MRYKRFTLWLVSIFLICFASSVQADHRTKRFAWAQLPVSGPGYTTYHTTTCTAKDHDSHEDMHYGTAIFVEILKMNAAIWASESEQTYGKIDIGDMSKMDGGSVAGCHNGHMDGQLADIRIIRTDKQNHIRLEGGFCEPFDPKEKKPKIKCLYSREGTMKLIDTFLLRESPITCVFFNDPEIIKLFKGKVEFLQNHHRHMHFQMKPC